MLLGLTGCIEQADEKKDTPLLLYEDAEFLDWLDDCNSIMLSYADYSLDAIESENWYSYSYWSERTQDRANKYLDEVDGFYLSYNYDRIRDEYKSYLLDQERAGYYSYLAAEAMIDFDYSSAITYLEFATDYTEKATAHIIRCTDMIEDL